MNDYKDILGSGPEGQAALSEAQLLAYLEGRMSEAERRTVEEILSAGGMESDALEGLQALSGEETTAMKHQLNAELQRTLHKKRRTRRGISGQRWTWIAILVILMLSVLGYAVIYLAKHH